MSLLHRGLHIVSKQLAYALVILAFIATLIIVSVYWLSNAVEQRQNEIASWVSDYIGYPVQIEKAGVHWIGLAPKLDVENITILHRDAEKELLSLYRLYVGLDLISSLSQAEPVLNDISLSGLDLSVIRTGEDQFVVQGIVKSDSNSEPVDWFALSELLSEVNLEFTTISYSDFVTPALSGHYFFEQAQFEIDGQHVKTIFNLELPDQLGESIQLVGEATLDKTHSLRDGHFESKFSRLNLEPLAQNLIWEDVSISAGQIDGALILELNNNTDFKVTTNLNAANLAVRSLTTSHTEVIDAFAAEVEFVSQGEGDTRWQLAAKNVALSMNSQQWMPTQFEFRQEANGTVHFSSDYLKLSDLTALASLTSLTPEFISQQKPAGDLSNLSVIFDPEDGLQTIRFDLVEGGMLPWGELPGVTGLTTSVDWSNQHGSIQLNSHDVVMYAETWLEDAIFFDSFTGLIRLNQDGDNWHINTESLRAWNNDLSVQVDGAVTQDSEGQITNELRITLRDVEVNTWKSYVPQKILSKDFKQWSDKAFVAGKVKEGQIILRGKLADFPYDNQSELGQFSMALDVESVQLHYAPDWPDIIRVDGQVNSEGSTLIIKSQKGKIAGFDFQDITTTIERFVLSDPILYVKGDVDGSTQKALNFLKNSPLKKRFSSVANQVAAEGQSTINLNLMVPLVHADDTSASGYVSFNRSTLSSVDLPELKVTDVLGKLHFNNQGVEAKSITARFFDEVVQVNVKPHKDKTIVEASGKTSVSQLNQLAQGTIPSDVSGEFNYTMDILIGEKTMGDFYVDAIVKSDLVGVSITLPAPFNKASDESRAFRAGIEHVDDQLVYTANYADFLKTILQPMNESQWRGEVRVGQGQPELPNNGIKMRGQMESLSVEPWLSWSESQNHSSEDSLIDDVSVSIAKIEGFSQSLSNVTLSMQRDGQGWRTQFRSDETKGSLYFPSDLSSEIPLDIQLDKVSLNFPEQSDAQVKDKQAMTLWPSMNLSVDALTINGMNLGTVKLNTIRSETSYEITQGQLSSPHYEANIKRGVWQQTTAGEQTQIELETQSDDLSSFLTSLGYVNAINADDVELRLSLAWPDSPINLNYSDLHGQIDLSVGSGQLTEIEPGAAGRIFGLLSVTAIPRRLILDFSDLFGKGFNFNSIKGHFDVADGFATTNDMKLNAESAVIEMTGPINFVDKRYDQQVTVTPNVSSTLPLAGAVAGGPVGLGVGAAILLFDKLADNLFDKNIVNLISYKYHLTGPWSDPQLSVIKPVSQ